MSINRGENTKLASTNNSDKPKLDTSIIGTNDFSQLPLLESNLSSCSFDTQDETQLPLLESNLSSYSFDTQDEKTYDGKEDAPPGLKTESLIGESTSSDGESDPLFKQSDSADPKEKPDEDGLKPDTAIDGDREDDDTADPSSSGGEKLAECSYNRSTVSPEEGRVPWLRATGEFNVKSKGGDWEKGKKPLLEGEEVTKQTLTKMAISEQLKERRVEEVVETCQNVGLHGTGKEGRRGPTH